LRKISEDVIETLELIPRRWEGDPAGASGQLPCRGVKDECDLFNPTWLQFRYPKGALPGLAKPIISAIVQRKSNDATVNPHASSRVEHGGQEHQECQRHRLVAHRHGGARRGQQRYHLPGAAVRHSDRGGSVIYCDRRNERQN
jgi:hypothetical protein